MGLTKRCPSFRRCVNFVEFALADSASSRIAKLSGFSKIYKINKFLKFIRNQREFIRDCSSLSCNHAITPNWWAEKSRLSSVHSCNWPTSKSKPSRVELASCASDSSYDCSRVRLLTNRLRRSSHARTCEHLRYARHQRVRLIFRQLFRQLSRSHSMCCSSSLTRTLEK